MKLKKNEDEAIETGGEEGLVRLASPRSSSFERGSRKPENRPRNEGVKGHGGRAKPSCPGVARDNLFVSSDAHR